jgi:hypothetical protein
VHYTTGFRSGSTGRTAHPPTYLSSSHRWAHPLLMQMIKTLIQLLEDWARATLAEIVSQGAGDSWVEWKKRRRKRKWPGRVRTKTRRNE